MGFDSPLGNKKLKLYKQHIIFFFLLSAGLLAGCSVHNEPVQKNEIAMRTGVSSMQKKVRGIANNDSLRTKDIKIDAYYHGTETKYLDGVKLVYNASEWKFWEGEPGEQVHYYWPFEGSKTSEGVTASTLDFVGFCPYTRPANIGTPAYDHSTGVSFTCNMASYMTSASQKTMQEFIVAVLDSQTLALQTAAGGVLPLQFKHPLAQIRFVINAASGTHVRIDSIAIDDLYTGGTCAFNGTTMSWSGHTGSAGLSLNEVNMKVGSAITVSDTVFVIPNNYGEKYLTVKATWDDWSNVTISNYGTNVNFNWEPGRIYTYNLTLDKYGLKVDVEKFTEQW